MSVSILHKHKTLSPASKFNLIPLSYHIPSPNAVPVGLAGNSIGELWTDATAGNPYLKVWTGSAWTKIYAGLADTAAFATQANSCIIASGAITAFATTANTALLASGAILASGVVTSAGTPSVLVLLSGLPSPTSYSSGTLIYQVQSSGTTPSGLFVRALNGWAFT